ncbi:hypothetical protein BTVI_63666 [Pitangus sulphuratus]|nr:hypothetical protein BTVI_63666 [Pitangus sulphuratus]
MSVGSKMGQPLPKVEPISNSGSTSGIDLKRGKNPLQLQFERRVRICMRKSSTDKVSEGEAEIPLQPVVKTMMRQALLPQGTHAGAVYEKLWPRGMAHLGGIHGELVPMGGTPHWSKARE